MTTTENNSKSAKRTAFKVLTIIFVIPLAIIAFLELTARIISPGSPAKLFIEEKLPDQVKVLRTNFQAVERFFPGKMARKPLAEIFPAKKPEGNLRIFVLGESAARGERLSDFSFSRMLETYLNTGLNYRKAEVINTGIPAINSWVIKEFAAELINYEPDLFIIYAGHNEFIGPYGPASVQGISGSRLSIELGIRASSLRLIQLMLGDALPPEMAKGWRGLEMFINNRISSDSNAFLSCRENWERNLRKIFSLAATKKIPVVFCKVPVNLRDCPPFASDEKHLTAEQKKEIAALIKRIEQQPSTDFFIELQAQNQATPDHALISYLLGHQLLSMNQSEKARTFFAQARNNDRFPVRIPQIFNETGEQIAKSFGASVIDLEKVFAENSSDGSCGKELVYDHVHLTEYGHYLVTKSLAEVIKQWPWPARSFFTRPFPEFDEMCNQISLTDYDLEQNLQSIIGSFQGPPFTLQYAADKRIEYYNGELKRLRERLQFVDCLANAQKYLQNYPWCFSGFNRAAMMLMRHEPELAIDYFARSLELNPFNPDAHNNRGMLLMQANRKEDASAHLFSAISLSPNLAMGHYNLAILRTSQNESEQAVNHYRLAVKSDPGMINAWRNLANIYFRSGKIGDALSVYQAAEEYNAEDIHLKIGQSNCLLELEKSNEAFAILTQLVASHPESPFAHFSLGLAYEKTLRFAQASHHYEKSGIMGHLPGLRKVLQLDLSENHKLPKENFMTIAEEGCRQTDFSDPWFIQIYASALLNQGKAQDALAVLHRAELLAAKRGETALAQEIRANIDLISQH